jgi:hypothetical protein
MEKFTTNKVNHNPYAEGSTKSKIYKAIVNNITSNYGEIEGIKEMVENFNNVIEYEKRKILIKIYEDIKNGKYIEDNALEPSDISQDIEQLKSEDTSIEPKTDDFSTEKIEESVCYTIPKHDIKELNENEISNFLNKIK